MRIARRNFVKVTPNFPDECRLVLETIREVYHYDAVARERGCRRRSASPSTRSIASRSWRNCMPGWRLSSRKESGAELRAGTGDPVSTRALEEADAVSRESGRAARQ